MFLYRICRTHSWKNIIKSFIRGVWSHTPCNLMTHDRCTNSCHKRLLNSKNMLHKLEIWQLLDITVCVQWTYSHHVSENVITSVIEGQFGVINSTRQLLTRKRCPIRPVRQKRFAAWSDLHTHPINEANEVNEVNEAACNRVFENRYTRWIVKGRRLVEDPMRTQTRFALPPPPPS